MIERTRTYKMNFKPLMGGEVVGINDAGLNRIDYGERLIGSFVRTHKHDGYFLCIYDTNSTNSVMIQCDIDDIPAIVAHIYRIEEAYPMTFVCDNPATHSLAFSKKILKAPGFYVYRDGNLDPVQYLNELTSHSISGNAG